MPKTILSPTELEAQRILSNVADIPKGGKLTLADLAADGFGGMNVFRTQRGGWLFQREFYRARGRFADNLPECLEEIEFYLTSGGHLSGPDNVRGF